MEQNLNQERQQAHALLDLLPPEKLNAVRSLLVEDEDITPETAEALVRARASLARGEGISHDEILSEFGLR